MAKKRGDEKKDEVQPDIGDINRFIGKFLEEANKKFQSANPNEPIVFGFNIHIGNNGLPVIENFGNVKQNRSEVQLSEAREPLVDVIEKERELVVIAEMPGVRKESVRISFREDSMDISASEKERSYHKIVGLPFKVDTKNYESKYNNGVLEISLHKA